VRHLIWVLALFTGGCRADPAGREVLSVYAASSLAETFEELEVAFELMHPDIDVRLTLAGSQVLRLQIEQGAPADVFASANPEHVQALLEAGLVRDAQAFAGNDLVVIVPLANPSGIESFDQLPLAERIVLGTVNVPAGRYAREVIHRASQQLGAGFEARVLGRVVSEETNVRLARAKVEFGEADAALVYRTDALSSDRVRVIPIPEALGVRASYVIAVAVRPRTLMEPAAEDWVAFVRSGEGRAVLGRHGFNAP